jgi:hypothetical protein
MSRGMQSTRNRLAGAAHRAHRAARRRGPRAPAVSVEVRLTEYRFTPNLSSGANLTLLAAERGLPIPKAALLEPPLRVGDEPSPVSDLGAQVAKLVVLARRDEAFELWVRRKSGASEPRSHIGGRMGCHAQSRAHGQRALVPGQGPRAA